MGQKYESIKQVIHIYGASGAGISTIGKYIADQKGFFFMDTDDYFWESTNPPYTTKRVKSERLAMMYQDISQNENVVIAGSLVDWGDELIPLFTLAIRVETDTKVRIERLEKREYRNFGNRINLGGDMYEIHLKFIEWAAKYDIGGLDIRSKMKHDEWQKQLCCPLMNLDGALPVEANYELLQDFL